MKNLTILIVIVFIALFSSCKKGDEPTPDKSFIYGAKINPNYKEILFNENEINILKQSFYKDSIITIRFGYALSHSVSREYKTTFVERVDSLNIINCIGLINPINNVIEGYIIFDYDYNIYSIILHIENLSSENLIYYKNVGLK